MQYDSSIPIAVFLGPSLKIEQAETILSANYYPPVRMGDIYRLLTTNVQLIIIIDGFFHANIPVWQREILAALKADIAVVGAASMGALRAAELAAYGMLGLGTIYHWYEQELIEGDDEVALLHLDIEHDYYPISEPLVNIRHTLENACLAGILTRQHSLALQQELKQLYYGDRTYAALFECVACQSLSPDTQKELHIFINTQTESLKQKDALEALRYCVNHTEQRITVKSAVLKPGTDIERPIEIHHRGVLSEQGQLFKLQEILALVPPDSQQNQDIINNASCRFFLLEWQKLTQVKTPDPVLNTYKNTFYQRNNISQIDLWLTRNGLIRSEIDQELTNRATSEWLLEQSFPELNLFQLAEFGIIKSCCPGFAHRLCASAIINDWAAQSGIDIPATVLATATEEQRRDFAQQLQTLNFSQTMVQQLFELDFCAQKIIEKTPIFFGFDLWSIDIAIIRELQLRGDIEKLAQHYQAPHA